ncbi:unnamed protein product [Darwinula stevensoni]|uniref:Acetylcholine receptor subunit alpha-like n=1 Tax=Darwinula stevensoni TaxID=69355 RepID=A0A7R9ACY8_9CRUS|nr:unnamed protein product [Darwinula stevensoni]CAG0900266.1 unnamed protein product [Darwinula stevensoni]
MWSGKLRRRRGSRRRRRIPTLTYFFFLPCLSLLLLLLPSPGSCGNPDAKRLYDDLLSNYNKLVRPVTNVSDALTVRIKLKLSQLIDVNLKNQIMTTNLWVEQYWYDYKLTWNPEEYGGVHMLHVPSDHIWRPDIVLYNNADGNFEVTLATKATLHNDGLVEWKPPAIYKSSCEIDVEYFPFDEQTCVMKFGSWTYDGFQVDLRHIDEQEGSNVVEIGVDLSEFYMSVEWDILEVPAVRNEKFYTCCDEPYLDITFNITMRRKTLFYTVNLIIPCMGISFLTVLVFYLPSDSGEKVNLSISILVSLTVFFLLVTEIIPPTSVSLPLLGKYLIFAMVSLSISILLSLTVFFLLLAEIIPPTSKVLPLLGKFVLFTMVLDTFRHACKGRLETDEEILVCCSICVTVVVLNVHFRSPQTHTMAPWVRRVFLQILPRLLVMKRPHYHLDRHRVMVRTFNGLEMRDPHSAYYSRADFSYFEPPPFDIPRPPRPRTDIRGMDLNGGCRLHGSLRPPPPPPPAGELFSDFDRNSPCRSPSHYHYCPEVVRAFEGVKFIAEHTRKEEESVRVKEDWKFVAMVLDRLFLWIFTLAVLVGTAGIILQAPTLYDDRKPIDVRLSEISAVTAKPRLAMEPPV